MRPGKTLMHGGKKLTMDLEMIMPTAIDWDKDGDVDLICGDEDGRVAFVENTGKIDRRGAGVPAAEIFPTAGQRREVRRAGRPPTASTGTATATRT